MAEFITLLLVVIGQFSGTGVGTAELSAQISQALLETQPVPLEEVQVTCTLSKVNELESIVFDISGLVLAPLEIDHAVISVQGIETSGLGKIGLSSISWEVEIGDTDLSQALGQHTSVVSGAQISTSKDGILVEGTYPLWRMKIPFSLAGQLVVQEQTHLVFELETSGVGQIKIPQNLTKLLEQEINPIYDLAEFSTRSKKELDIAKQQLNYKFYLLVDKITLGQGKITVTGSA